MRRSWRDFVKPTGMISSDEKTFVLTKGKTPWHVAKEWKAMHPSSKLDIGKVSSMILAFNPGVKPSGYMAGVVYKMPRFQPAESSPIPSSPSRKATQAANPTSMTMVSPHRGMRVPRGFLDLMMHIDRYGVKNSEGKVDRERVKAAITDYFTNVNPALMGQRRKNNPINNTGIDESEVVREHT